MSTTRKEKSQLVRDIENEISDITDRMDASYVDDFDIQDAIDVLDWDDGQKDIIKNFIDNYSSKTIGLFENDDLTAEELIEKFGADVIVKTALNNCDTVAVDYHYQYNEIFSLSCGEYEHQIDVEYETELQSLLEQATDAEVEAAGADRSSFCSYGHPADRFILKLDPQAFLQALSEIGNTPKPKKKKKNYGPVSPVTVAKAPQLTLAYSKPMTGYELLRLRVTSAAKRDKIRASQRLDRNSAVKR